MRVGKKIDYRRASDLLYLVKIRDYSLPIAAFLSADDVMSPFYYLARGDGLIIATYDDSRVVNKWLLELPTVNE